MRSVKEQRGKTFGDRVEFITAEELWKLCIHICLTVS